MNICICGGGNLGHAIGGYLAAKSEHKVNIMTRRPDDFVQAGEPFTVILPSGNKLVSYFNLVSDKPQDALKDVDLVLLCLPGFAIESELKAIAPYVTGNMMVGSVFCSSGFFPMAEKILPEGTKLYGFQRVPFIARINEYGHEVNLTGYRDQIHIATANIECPDTLAGQFNDLFDEDCRCLSTPLAVTLTNSNPILHPSRLYALFKDKEIYDHLVLFYNEWNERSSDILIKCDEEFQRIRASLGISQDSIPTLLDHYESVDSKSMTAKISSIKSLATITTPMIALENNQFAPDYSSRYFTEDIPYGMLLIKAYGLKTGNSTPMIDSIIYWAQEKIGKEFLVDGVLSGKDVLETPVKYII